MRDKIIKILDEYSDYILGGDINEEIADKIESELASFEQSGSQEVASDEILKAIIHFILDHSDDEYYFTSERAEEIATEWYDKNYKEFKP